MCRFPGIREVTAFLQPDQTQIIDPGTYGTLTINARAHLKLRTGTYYFRGLTLDGDSLLDVDNTAGPVYVYIRDSFAFNGTVVPTTATKPNVLLGYAGTSALNIQRSLWGILVAPNSSVTVAPTGTTGHTGSFFAKSLTVQAATTIHHRAFGPTEFCPGSTTCSVLCPCGPGGVCQSTADCQPGLSCTSGVCTSPNTDDGNPCTADSIDPNGTIHHTPLPAGASCSDANLCNGEEVCNATAQCLPGTVPSIDDANPCTTDACTPAGGITHVPVAAGTSCSNGSVCDGDEVCDAGGVCQPGTPPTIDDSNPCTTDACTPEAGVTHTPLPTGTSCADGNACNGSEVCNATGACQPGAAPDLNDQNACTEDSCDPATGIHHNPVPSGTSCADADLCNGAEACNGSGTCVAGTPSSVDDGNPCTADVCDPVLGVSHTPVEPGTSCDDGDLCNGTSMCNAGAVCTPGAPPPTDDGNPCTTDGCTAAVGVTHVPVPEGTSCADGNACNGPETCDAQGSCTPGTAPTVDDQNPCTTDTCDPIGGVTNTPVPAGTACPNADACDGAEMCNQNGTCVAGAPPIVDDGNPCTADACDAATGVSHVPVGAGTSCVDANVCNGDETCDATGACQPGTPPAPDDGNPCTADSCDPADGVLHVPVSAGTSCADSDVCNGGETCNGIGACNAGTPPAVDDGNPCTADACDPVTGVSHAPVAQGTSCVDGNACNGAETCNAIGSCIAGTSPVVDDQNLCTADSCDPVLGVVHTPVANGTACSDGNACTQSDSCQAGACAGGQPVVCSAPDQCHDAGTCDPLTGVCSAPAKPNGAACSDGNACTTVDSCQSGLCTGGSPVVCVAADQCHGPGSCDPATGMCSSPAQPDGTSCNDADPCTGEDACTAGVCGGDPLAQGSYCDDNDATQCNGFYACDAAGTCADEVAPIIDDGNPCTADVCDAGTGNVTHDPTPGVACGNPCSGTGMCSAVGACEITSPGVNIDDADPCTADACDPATAAVTHTLLPEGAGCDTNGVCDGIDTCSAQGACVPGTPPVIDDGNVCTFDYCDEAEGVQHQVTVGNPCGDTDQDLCNGFLACDENGACIEPATVVVDDSNPCTIDSCDPEFGAVNTPDEGAACGDLCIGFGQCNQFGFCASDNPPVIEDGDACTQDLCDPETGNVTHPPAPAGTLCGDGDPCNGTESCSGDGECLPGTAPEIDDENPCTFDVCTTVDGGFMQIFHDPMPSGTVCGDDDVDPCNGVSVCTAAGNCSARAYVDDENPCTIDSCDLAGGIQHEPVAEGTSCGDGDACNGAEICDGAGACQPGSPVQLSDGNDCTADHCNADGTVSHVLLEEGTPCEDQDLCTQSDTCSVTGVCLPGPAVDPNDGNPCTSDSCDPFAGPIYDFVPEGTVCASAEPCATERTCNPTGFCRPAEPVVEDDGDPCTEDTCDPSLGFVHTQLPAGTWCTDQVFCNGTEVCDANGACQPDEPVIIDDDNPCTNDTCVDTGPDNGFVRHIQGGTPPDDQNPCTADTCDPVLGPVHNPLAEGTSCSDGNVCNGSESCNSAAVCTPGAPPVVDDANACTIDSCDAIAGVSHLPTPAGTACEGANCEGGLATSYECNGVGACVEAAVVECTPYGCGAEACVESCASDSDCALTAVCQAGACIAGPNEPCNDNNDCSTAACLDGACCPEDVASYPFASAQFDPTTVTDFAVQAAPLYSGASATQSPDPGAIDPNRVAIVRGRVLALDGTPLGCVPVTIVGAPEVGSTRTRPDGSYAIAVNGGGRTVVQHAVDGYVTAFRRVDPRWHEFAVADDVRLVPHGPASPVSASATDITVVAGEVESDSTGTRRATLLFDPGTTAQVTGESSPRTDYSVRVKEVTNLAHSRQAMPAELPATSAFTYAVSLALDGVESKRVTFSQPIPVYIENFLEFPTGVTVPVGYFDEQTAEWVASDNGRVIRIVRRNPAGEAEIDPPVDMDSAERIRLASLYPVGTSLWRFTVDHFSTWDANWGFGPPVGAAPPNGPTPGQGPPPCPDGGGPPRTETDSDLACGPSPSGKCPAPSATRRGSIITCESQTLQEKIPVTGAPFELVYSSSRQPGGMPPLEIPVASETLPEPLRRIELNIGVAGRQFHVPIEIPSSSERPLRYSFQWDGFDGFGRRLYGPQRVFTDVSYVYGGSYQLTERFGYNGNGVAIAGSKERFEVTLSQRWAGWLDQWDARSAGLGGWSLNIHHSYDPRSGIVHLGDGGRLDTSTTTPQLVTIAGNGVLGFSGDGGPAVDANINITPSLSNSSLAIAPDGTVYFADAGNHRVRKIGRDGIITTVAGGGSVTSYPHGDGGPATNATFDTPTGIAIAADGSLYVTDKRHHRIRKIDPAGIITTAVGTGDCCFNDDGPPLTRLLMEPTGITIAPDGTIYFTDNRLRRFKDDHVSVVFTGGYLTQPAVGPDGSIFVSDYSFNTIRRIGNNGFGAAYAGTGLPGVFPYGEGGPATSATISQPDGVVVGPDGLVYFTDTGHNMVRRVNGDGSIETVVGSGTPAFNGDNLPATRANISRVRGLGVGPDSSIYVVDTDNQRIRKTTLPPPLTAPDGTRSIPSYDGRNVFVFSAQGRHLKTIDAFTGVTQLAFDYDASGLLTAVADRELTGPNARITEIVRDDDGRALAIISPDGQQTILQVDDSQDLRSVTNPDGGVHSFDYASGGLLVGMRDPKGNAEGTAAFEFTFEDDRLVRDEDPLGNAQTLARSSLPQGARVTHTTPLGRVTTYDRQSLDPLLVDQQTTGPDGLITQTLTRVDGKPRC